MKAGGWGDRRQSEEEEEEEELGQDRRTRTPPLTDQDFVCSALHRRVLFTSF